jgi:Fe-S-cluster-containing hydrogenase component 2
MTLESSETRIPRAPVAQCRLCSAVCSFDAVTTEALRHSLRAFMAEHRHDGLADIVIEISDNESESAPDSAPERVGAGSGVS